MKYTCILLFLANPATAACNAGEQVFVSCQIEDSRKTASVCYDDTHAYYRFGIAGQTPELSLTNSIADLDYQPWNGSGRDIWEEVSFRVGAYVYAVHGGFERPWGDELPEDKPHRKFGAVSVAHFGEIFMDLDCDRATTEFVWQDDLWKAKERLGLVWDYRAGVWVAQSD